MLKGKVNINEQEANGNYRFAGVTQYMTRGFQNTFGEDSQAIAFTAFALILEKYPDNADYLQTFEYLDENGKKNKILVHKRCGIHYIPAPRRILMGGISLCALIFMIHG